MYVNVSRLSGQDRKSFRMLGEEGAQGVGRDEYRPPGRRLPRELCDIFQRDMTCRLDDFLASINLRTFSSWFSQLGDPTTDLGAWNVDLSRCMDIAITFVGCSSPPSLCIATVVRDIDRAVSSILAPRKCDRADRLAAMDATVAELSACAESAPNDLDEFLGTFEGEEVEFVPLVAEAAPGAISLGRREANRLRRLVGTLRADDPIDVYIGDLVKQTVERSGVYVSLEPGHRQAFSASDITRPTLVKIERLINGLRPRPFDEYSSDYDE
jgi:hypothetical protein